MLLQPRHYVGVLVGAAVVQDDVDLLARGTSRLIGAKRPRTLRGDGAINTHR